MFGFSGTSIADPEVEQICELFAANKIGGIVLFKHNVKSPSQVKQLIAAIKDKAPKAIIAVDQEGGKVQRFNQDNGFNSYHTAAHLGEVDFAVHIDQCKKMATELAGLGVNLNFAPVVDIKDEVSSVICGYERAYSDDPLVVTEYALELIKIHQQVGVKTCAKHFPGHGLASGDTHHGLVDISKTWQSDLELLPYKLMCQQGCLDSVMTAHLMHKTEFGKHPFSLATGMVTKHLRSQLGYSGMIITDDLCMKAIANNYSANEAVPMALAAGNDMVIYSNNANSSLLKSGNNIKKRNLIALADGFIKAISDFVAKDKISKEQLQKSIARVEQFTEVDATV
ncbi:MAG: glycoside hydrolase family 3 N-terminal domain-containing protein [Pseudomonadota bacterium]